MTLIRPLNKGQSHSFWYKSISQNSHMRVAVNSNFCSRTHRLATNDRRWTQNCTNSATVIVMLLKN